MRQVVRYQNLIIPSKIKCEIRIIVDDRGVEFLTTNDNSKNTIISFFPTLLISIMRPSEINDDGTRTRAPWNPNDTLSMNKFQIPIFTKELEGIIKDLEIPELYVYHGQRLELNEEIAAKIRRVFVIGNTTLEFSAVVITQGDDSRVEGIKVKFNNEQSSFMLTLNELTALDYNLNNLDLDNVALLLYLNFINKPQSNFTSLSNVPNVDILPKTN